MKPSRSTALIRYLLLAAAFTSIIGTAAAQQPGQRTFKSAEDASQAYFEAAQNEDDKALLEILGPAGRNIVKSGDSAEDADSRAMFVVRYMETHRLVPAPDGSVTLYVGAEARKMPIPLVNTGGAWYFDAAAGSKQVLAARIATNEAAAARACRDLFDAQSLYYLTLSRAGSPAQYAQQFISENGDHAGLYWHNAMDEFDSPLDPLIAYAGFPAPAGSDAAHTPMPYHGYFFRMLPSQGSHARSGAKNYLVAGRMVGGFAFMAYPAKYGSTGTMTFVVNQEGMVYRKDLGPDTRRVASSATQYDPDSTWESASATGGKL